MAEDIFLMISTEIKKLSSCRKELTIVMDKADLEPIREQQAKVVQKEAEFPGFRRGKAPMHLVRRNFAQAIETYTLEAALDEGLRRSAEENKLAIVGNPEAKKLEFNQEGNLVSVIEVDTFPEFETLKYKDISLTKDVYIISDKAVDDAIEDFRRRKAEVVTIEDESLKGHIVTLDMQELGDADVVLVGKKYDDIVVRLGEGKFDPQMEEQLVGVKAGEEKMIEKRYPDDFPQAEFAGKVEKYKVKIKQVQKENLPELTEEFIQSVNNSFKTIDDLKARTRDQIELEYKRMSDNRLFEDMAQILLQDNPFDVPHVLVHNYLDHMVKDIRGRNPEFREDEIREHYHGQAEFTLKWHYLREQLAIQENITVTEEDVTTFLAELKDDKLREIYQTNEGLLQKTKESILERKIDDFLIGHANVTENIINV